MDSCVRGYHHGQRSQQTVSQLCVTGEVELTRCSIFVLEQDLQRVKADNVLQSYANMSYPIEPVTNEFEVCLPES